MMLHLFTIEDETWVAESIEQAHTRLLMDDPSMAEFLGIDDWEALPDDKPLTVGTCEDPDDKTTRTCAEWAKDFGEIGPIFGDWC